MSTLTNFCEKLVPFSGQNNVSLSYQCTASVPNMVFVTTRQLKWIAEIALFHSIEMILPRVTDCELVVDPTRLVATHWYSPASVDAMLYIVSDGVFTFPPEYLLLSDISLICPLNNHFMDVTAEEPDWT